MPESLKRRVWHASLCDCCVTPTSSDRRPGDFSMNPNLFQVAPLDVYVIRGTPPDLLPNKAEFDLPRDLHPHRFAALPSKSSTLAAHHYCASPGISHRMSSHLDPPRQDRGGAPSLPPTMAATSAQPAASAPKPPPHGFSTPLRVPGPTPLAAQPAALLALA